MARVIFGFPVQTRAFRATICSMAMAARARQAKAESERRVDLDKLQPAPEPAAQPDDTFYRVLAAMYNATGKLSTSEQKAVQAAEASAEVSAGESPEQPPEQPTTAAPS